FYGHQGRAGSLAFHPSGRYLASGGEQPGDIKLWDLTRPQEYVTVASSPSPVGRVEGLGFSADSEAIHVARTNGWLQTSRSATGLGRDLKRLDLTAKPIAPVAFAAFSA